MATMKTIVLKYDARCAKCAAHIKAGEKANYGGGIASHIECPGEKVGALVVFPKGTTKEQAEALIAKLGQLEFKQVEKYDPAWGEPVWYIP